MPTSRSQFDEHRVHAFEALKRDGQKNALELLHRIAEQVRPIMQKRGWRVGLLKEFLPSNPGLLGLNVNRGQEVRIRLRQSEHADGFLDYHSLLGTMLHELCHNAHGNHSAAFFNLLDEVTAECETIMASGAHALPGLGFATPGVRLGTKAGGIDTAAGANPQSMAARAALARFGKSTGADGRRLGGSDAGKVSGRSARELAAQAAERRRLANIYCGNCDAPDGSPADTLAGLGAAAITASSSSSHGNGEASHPINDTGRSTNPSSQSLAGASQGVSGFGQPRAARPTTAAVAPLPPINAQPSPSQSSRSGIVNSEASETWSCRHCTFINHGRHSGYSICLMCARTQH